MDEKEQDLEQLETDKETIDEDSQEEDTEPLEDRDILDSLNPIKEKRQLSLEDVKDIKKIADNPEAYTEGIKKTGESIGSIVKSIFSLPGLIVLVVIVVLWVIWSMTYVLGPVAIGDECNAPTLIELKDDSDIFKESYEYFRRNNISPVLSLAISRKLESEELIIDYSKDETIKWCDNKCFEYTVYKMNGIYVEESEYPIEMKALDKGKIEHIDSKILLRVVELSKEYDLDWKNPRIFYKAIAKEISESYTETEQTKESNFKKVLGMLSLSYNDDYQNLKEETKELESEIRCVVMGSGNGRGRTDGGSAIDSGLGALDMSNLIAFLESYCTEEKISISDTDSELFGGLRATPEMREAKAMAVAVGGADPLDGGEIAPNGVYASCDRNVAIAIKALEIDPNIPWGGVVNMKDYFIANPDKWQKLDNNCDRESGDIVIHNKPTQKDSHGHIAIYGVTEDGEEKIYEASFQTFLPWKHKAGPCEAEVDYIGRTLEYWRFVGDK